MAGARVGTVWLERPGGPLPLDEVLLERFALAAAAVWERGGVPATMADPALVELVIAEETGEPARARALNLLGLAPDIPLRALAVGREAAGPRRGGLSAEDLAAVARGLGGRAALLGEVGVVLARGGLPAEAESSTSSMLSASSAETPGARPLARPLEGGPFAEVPAGVLLGAGPVTPAAEAHESWRRARGSLRSAAAELHLHHTSVAKRLRNVEARLGLRLERPDDLLRAARGGRPRPARLSISFGFLGISSPGPRPDGRRPMACREPNRRE